ncbi:hypothetical protein CLOP_g20683 [Closterium sp. NIES-67]|nr:hypothetical protein CLOP_g20683 [Closterium sp. NIES-67]
MACLDSTPRCYFYGSSSYSCSCTNPDTPWSCTLISATASKPAGCRDMAAGACVPGTCVSDGSQLLGCACAAGFSQRNVSSKPPYCAPEDSNSTAPPSPSPPPPPSSPPPPSESPPSEAAPSEAAPSEALPSEALPSEALPSEALPSQAAPSEAAPSAAAPSASPPPDKCASLLANPCQPGICASNASAASGYSCDCPNGFDEFTIGRTTICSVPPGSAGAPQGSCSQFSTNPCLPGPCVNDSSAAAGYSCHCPSGYVQTSSNQMPSCSKEVNMWQCSDAIYACMDITPRCYWVAGTAYSCSCGMPETPFKCSKLPGRPVNCSDATRGLCLPGFCRTNGSAFIGCLCATGFSQVNPSAGDPYCAPSTGTGACPLKENPCGEGVCTGTGNDTGYTCTCPPGYHAAQANGSLTCTTEPSSGVSSGLSAAAITGIAVGAACLLLLVILALFLWLRHTRQQPEKRTGLKGAARIDQVPLCQELPLSELTQATDNWSPHNLLGTGGYGDVYRGVPAADPCSVWAVKRAKVITKDFRREVQQMASKHHPNLVRLLGYCVHMDAGTEEHEQIVVYEFMDGGDLLQYMHAEKGARPPLSLEQRLSVLIDIARGLQYLHSFGIVHRDIKPANILLDRHTTAKIADFGIARMGDESSSGDTTRILGTPGYVDPSYSKSRKATTAADVYSYGVVMLELLTGRRALLPLGDQNVHIRQWAEPLLACGDIESFRDPTLDAPHDTILQLGQLALRCTAMPVTGRPHMDQVVSDLSKIHKSAPGGGSSELSAVDAIMLSVEHPTHSFDEAIALAVGSQQSALAQRSDS